MQSAGIAGFRTARRRAFRTLIPPPSGRIPHLYVRLEHAPHPAAINVARPGRQDDDRSALRESRRTSTSLAPRLSSTSRHMLDQAAERSTAAGQVIVLCADDQAGDVGARPGAPQRPPVDLRSSGRGSSSGPSRCRGTAARLAARWTDFADRRRGSFRPGGSRPSTCRHACSEIRHYYSLVRAATARRGRARTQMLAATGHWRARRTCHGTPS